MLLAQKSCFDKAAERDASCNYPSEGGERGEEGLEKEQAPCPDGLALK